jgi:arsenate reductase (glutaredoxin)
VTTGIVLMTKQLRHILVLINSMKKVYHLSSCSTCSRILSELDLSSRKFIFQDIKTERITDEQLQELKALAGSDEALFSRVALKYKTLDPKPSTEQEYRALILAEYTFLKRPVIVQGASIFIGNAKKTVAAAAEAIAGQV